MKDTLAREFNKILDKAFTQEDSAIVSDFYSGYTYPLSNIHLTEQKTLIFQFALPGCQQKNIDLGFEGDYLVLNVDLPNLPEHNITGRFLKKTLVIKAVHAQKFYVPEERFNHEGVSALLKHGILTVKVPARAVKNKLEKMVIQVEEV